jgi:hypothetical protein
MLVAETDKKDYYPGEQIILELPPALYPKYTIAGYSFR